MAAVPDVRAVLHGGCSRGLRSKQVCDQAEARAPSSFAQQEQNRFLRSNCGGLLRHTGQSAEAERIQQSEAEPRMLWTSPEVELLEHGSSESQKIIIFFPKKVVQPKALSHADTHQWQTDLDSASSQRAVCWHRDCAQCGPAVCVHVTASSVKRTDDSGVWNAETT